MHIRIYPFVSLAAAALLFVGSADAHAQDRFRGVARLGGEHGGDKVIQFRYEDGSTPDVLAGGGIVLSVGGVAEVLRFGPHAVEAQANVGLKYRTIPPASNQEAHWLRFPVEALAFYRAPVGIRVGGGVVTHLRNVLSASGDAAEGRVEFRNTPGLVLQADYVRGNVGFDLRYTALEYEIDGGASDAVDASSVGLGISYYFGRTRRSTPATAPVQ